jgi:hypothetical protein
MRWRSDESKLPWTRYCRLHKKVLQWSVKKLLENFENWVLFLQPGMQLYVLRPYSSVSDG